MQVSRNGIENALWVTQFYVNFMQRFCVELSGKTSKKRWNLVVDFLKIESEFVTVK